MKLDDLTVAQKNVLHWLLTSIKRSPEDIEFRNGDYVLDLGYQTYVVNKYLFNTLASAYRVKNDKLSKREEVFIRKCELLWGSEEVTSRSLRDHCYGFEEYSEDWLIEHAAMVEILLDQ